MDALFDCQSDTHVVQHVSWRRDGGFKLTSVPSLSNGLFNFNRPYVHFTDLILLHLLQFVQAELLLLQAVQNHMTQAGELTKRVGKGPQPLIDDLTEREQPVGHGRPPFPQSDLEQSPDDPSSVLWRGKELPKPCSDQGKTTC